MKSTLVAVILCITSVYSFAQTIEKPSEFIIQNAPEWAQMMYSDTPNVFEIDRAYNAYYKDNLFEKNYHTQQYKRWRRVVNDYVNELGFVDWPSAQEILDKRSAILQDAQSNGRSGTWTLLGPVDTYNTDGTVTGEQGNVYCIDQSVSNPQIMYCGTETSEIYKSTDGGLSWFNVSLNDPFAPASGFNAIKIHPTNPDIVLAGAGILVFKTIDGGITWSNVFSASKATEIVFLESNPSIVLMSTFNGAFRSTDTGQSWTQSTTRKSWDIKLNTANDNIVYLASHNSAQDLSEFYISTDAGISYTLQINGWHASTDPNREDLGVRLAVTDADPNRIYAHLIGESKPNDHGFIGLYRSDDGGYTWTLPNGPPGGPYSPTHTNLAIAEPNWTYQQGFYNCAITCSNTNPDEILVGGLSLHKSTDGGNTFSQIAGYTGFFGNLIHVDMQDFRTFGNTCWITTDGGIYRSTDFFNTVAGMDVRMSGIHSAEYWGFGQGWNEDVTVGGLYHNGIISSFDNWGTGNFMQLFGGEPASGYVNPGESRKVYSTQLGGRIVPLTIGDPVPSFPFGINPNESYWGVESSELEFHPNCYLTAFTGKENKLWQSTDQGITFNAYTTFGTNPDDKITYIEIPWSNTDVMYVCQQMNSGNLGKLWKTTDAGTSWTELTLPISANNRNMLIQVDPENENIVYIAFRSAGSASRIFKSTDGGLSWTNLTTPTLVNEAAKSIAFCGGTDGGIYYASNNTVFYRNNTMTDWEQFADGLPVWMNTNIFRPFYRDSKVRLASYGKGLWESPMYEQPTKPIANISVDKLSDISFCGDNVFHFIDHSMIDHANATLQWQFQGGTPSTSSNLEEIVTYTAPGSYLVTLSVTNANGQTDVDSLYIEILNYPSNSVWSEGFEGTNFPPDFFSMDNFDQDVTWQHSLFSGGFSTSSQSMVIENFVYNGAGEKDDIKYKLDMSFLDEALLTFDVAYSCYGGSFSDSLQVLATTDCGLTYDTLYFKGGADLASAPDQTSFFEPTANQWRVDSVDLSNYEGMNDVAIIFRAICGFGNNLYIDNINLSAINFAGVDELTTEYSLFPNPVAQGESVQIKTPFNEEVTIEVFSASGKIVYRKKHLPNSSLSTANFSKGAYLCVITSSSQIKKKMFVVE